MSSIRAAIIPKLPLFVLSALLLAGCSEEKAEVVQVVRPVKTVEIAAAGEGRALNYSGSVRARTEMNLGFRVSGKITERLVDIGDRVSAGDLLARIDAADYELLLKSASAGLDSATRQLETAELARSRAEQLFTRNVVAKSQLEQAVLGHEQAIAAHASAQSALEQAKNQVSYASLNAVESGIVTAISADVGQVVSAGSPVATVAVDGEKEVEIAVPEMDIAEFAAGKQVGVSFWSDDMLNLEGRVREVAGSADARSRTFAVRVSVPNDPRILLGMTATIKTTSATNADMVTIPLAALSKKDGDTIVWTVNTASRTVHARPVTISDFSADGVRVTAGLAAGDVVVAAGTQFMTENLEVRLPDTGTRQSASAGTAAVLR